MSEIYLWISKLKVNFFWNEDYVSCFWMISIIFWDKLVMMVEERASSLKNNTLLCVMFSFHAWQKHHFHPGFNGSSFLNKASGTPTWRLETLRVSSYITDSSRGIVSNPLLSSRLNVSLSWGPIHVSLESENSQCVKCNQGNGTVW